MQQNGNLEKSAKAPDTLQVTIVSPETTLFEGAADSVVVPGEKGQFEILKQHAPIISSLTAGIVICNGPTSFEQTIKGGFVEVANNRVSLCIEV